MSTIGYIKANLSLESAAFTAGLKKAESSLKSFGNGLATVAKGAAVAGAAIVASLGVAAYKAAGYISAQMEAIDVTAKLSDNLGFTTEALVGWTFAADLAGVSAESMNMGLANFVRSMSEANNLTSPVSQALASLGLNAATLGTMLPDDALRAVVDKISQIKSPADRAAIAVELFGKAGKDMGSLLAGGAAGLKAAEEEARKLGLTFSRIDAAQVEAANDALTRLSKLFTGIWTQLAIQLSPFIEAAANGLLQMGNNGSGAAVKIIDGFGWVLTSVAKLADYFALLQVGFLGFKLAGLAAVVAVIGVFDALGQAVVKVLNLLPGNNIVWDESIGAFTDHLVKEMDTVAGEMQTALDVFSNGENEKKATEFFKGIQEKAALAAKEVAKNSFTPKLGSANSVFDKLPEFKVPNEEKKNNVIKSAGAISQRFGIAVKADAATSAFQKSMMSDARDTNKNTKRIADEMSNNKMVLIEIA